MIKNVVVARITRTYFHPKNIVSVMINFFDEDGTLQGSQLLDAALFPDNIIEGQSIHFRNEHLTLFYNEMNKKD